MPVQYGIAAGKLRLWAYLVSFAGLGQDYESAIFYTVTCAAAKGVPFVIIYLHGFSSAGSSQKAALLREILAPTPVLSPSYPAHRPQAAVEYLEKYIGKVWSENPAVTPRVPIGSSLGGYYGRYLARRFEDVRLVLINPALKPQLTLAPYVGMNINQATGEPFELTPDSLSASSAYRAGVHGKRVSTLVLLDEGDELIDYRDAQTVYNQVGRVLVYPDGSHCFEHLSDAGDEIRAFCLS
jgi:predicted esterase YcpF (UPF0227 family)